MFERNRWYDRLPDESLSVYEEYQRLFFETMYERMMIWKRRFVEQRPRPWTDNVILRDNKFTNVYRELDRSSQWQIRNIICDDSLDLRNYIWKIMVYRYFNNPDTFVRGREEMGWRNGIPDWESYDIKEFADFMDRIKASGQNPFTNAYLINSNTIPGKTRNYCYCQKVIPALHENVSRIVSTVRDAKTPEEIVEFLKTLPAVATFIAHEFYQDFTYIPRYTDREFMLFDQNDYTNVGPGASVGIRLIYPSLEKSEQKQAIYCLRDIAPKFMKRIEEEREEPMYYLEWDKINRRYYSSSRCNLTLHQIEMWLCEFQKYWKMTIGEGKQRSSFKPRTESLIVG